jgi:hypothetical protein
MATEALQQKKYSLYGIMPKDPMQTLPLFLLLAVLQMDFATRRDIQYNDTQHNDIQHNNK